MFLIRLCLLSVGGAPPEKNQSSFTDGKLMTVVSYSLQLARCYSFLEGLCHMMHNSLTASSSCKLMVFYSKNISKTSSRNFCDLYHLEFLPLLPLFHISSLFLKMTINEYKKSRAKRQNFVSLLIMSGYWSLMMLVMRDLTSSFN